MSKEQRKHALSQAAEILRVSPQWLRFGERLGILPLARPTSGDHRFDSLEAIERLQCLGVGARKQRLGTC